MVRETRMAPYGRKGVDASRPEVSGRITSQKTPAKNKQPPRRASIGEGGREVLHILDSVDRTRGVCGQAVGMALPHLGLEHWGTSGARWCKRCEQVMGWG